MSEINQESQENELIDFLEQIFRLDQKTPSRTNASECYKKLKSRERDFIGTEIEKEYWNKLSLELFHLGQTEAIKNQNTQAKEYFLEAQEAAKKGIDDAWLAYIEGTLFYLENNITGIKQTINRIADKFPANIRILQSFIKGLKERGYPNYEKDYKS